MTSICTLSSFLMLLIFISVFRCSEQNKFAMSAIFIHHERQQVPTGLLWKPSQEFSFPSPALIILSLVKHMSNSPSFSTYPYSPDDVSHPAKRTQPSITNMNSLATSSLLSTPYSIADNFGCSWSWYWESGGETFYKMMLLSSRKKLQGQRTTMYAWQITNLFCLTPVKYLLVKTVTYTSQEVFIFFLVTLKLSRTILSMVNLMCG